MNINSKNSWINTKKVKSFNNTTLEETKNKVSETIEFDDIEFRTFIRWSKHEIIIKSQTNKVVLSAFIFWTIKKYLKTEFHDYISHPMFKKILFEELKLEWNYKTFIDEQNWIYELIKISDDSRFNWIDAYDVDIMIEWLLNLRSQEEIDNFLNKVVYWIDISIETYISKDFHNYIHNLIHTKVKELYNSNKKNTKNIDWNNEIFIKAMADKIYRDNFDYTNKIAWHKLLSEITKVILEEILSWDRWTFNREINWNITNIIKAIENSWSEKIEANIIKNILNNDYILNFQEKIKLYFEKFYKTDINEELLNWSILYLIRNNNLHINIEWLIDTIFRIDKDSLIKIFSVYNNKTLIENWEEYIYHRFHIRDIHKNNKKYDIKEMFEYIKLVIKEKDKITSNYIEKLKNLKIAEFQQYNYNWTVNKLKYDIEKLEKEVEKLSKKLKKKEKEIQELINNKKSTKTLEAQKQLLLSALISKMKELDNTVVKEKDIHSRLYQNIITLQNQVKDLKILKKKIESQYTRISEDFSKTLLFWRKKKKA